MAVSAYIIGLVGDRPRVDQDPCGRRASSASGRLASQAPESRPEATAGRPRPPRRCAAVRPRVRPSRLRPRDGRIPLTSESATDRDEPTAGTSPTGLRHRHHPQTERSGRDAWSVVAPIRHLLRRRRPGRGSRSPTGPSRRAEGSSRDRCGQGPPHQRYQVQRYIASGEEVTAGEAAYSEIFTVCKDVPPDDPGRCSAGPATARCPGRTTTYQRRHVSLHGRTGRARRDAAQAHGLGLGVPDPAALTTQTRRRLAPHARAALPAGSSSSSRGIGAHKDTACWSSPRRRRRRALASARRCAGEAPKRNGLEHKSSAGMYENEEPWTFVDPSLRRPDRCFPGDTADAPPRGPRRQPLAAHQPDRPQRHHPGRQPPERRRPRRVRLPGAPDRHERRRPTARR